MNTKILASFAVVALGLTTLAALPAQAGTDSRNGGGGHHDGGGGGHHDGGGGNHKKTPEPASILGLTAVGLMGAAMRRRRAQNS